MIVEILQGQVINRIPYFIGNFYRSAREGFRDIKRGFSDEMVFSAYHLAYEDLTDDDMDSCRNWLLSKVRAVYCPSLPNSFSPLTTLDDYLLRYNKVIALTPQQIEDQMKTYSRSLLEKWGF